MRVATLIPVRLAASRYPNKPFAVIKGLPMFHFIYKQIVNSYPNTYLATCDKEVEKYCMANQLKFIHTDPNHISGTDRIGEATKSLEKNFNIEKIINIQGDMPFIKPKHIKILINNLNKFEMSTLCCPFKDEDEFKDLNKVKLLISNKNKFAENFSRKPIIGKSMNINIFHHIGLYGYQMTFLREFLKMPISNREKSEKLEQLRLSNLNRIGVSLIKENILGVDTPEDLIRVNQILNHE